METPEIAGIHHIALTVNDAPVASLWYRDVLGFRIGRQWQQGDITKVAITWPGLSLVLASHGDKAIAGDFSERRNGLDHLGFAVADRAALLEWKKRLERLEVVHSEPVEGSSGSLIAFRDPDNIALEFYTLSSD